MRAHNEAGYSLVELLVVLALLGLIAVAINGGIRFGARVWERTESHVESGELARGGQALLRDVLSRIYPHEPDPNVAGEPAAFAGERESMEFRGMSSSAFGGAGLTHFSLSARRAGGMVTLAIAFAPERGPAAEQQEVLLSGAREIDFAYAQLANGAVIWNETWAGQPGVPLLIRVRVLFPPESGLSWPDLIVRPRIDRDAACVYDAVSFGCRRG